MRKTKTILGIDPGGSGAGVALQAPNARLPGVMCLPVHVFPPDPRSVHKFAGERPFVDWLSGFDPNTTEVFLEHVHAFPGRGVVSTWKFAQNYGFIRGALLGLGFVRVTLVSPQKWQGALGVGKHASKTTHKNALKKLAHNHFPRHKWTLQTADAALIAYYGYVRTHPHPNFAHPVSGSGT